MVNGKKVLIIEDSNFICTVLAEGLSEKGFEVVICHDGNCGVKTALQELPDIIILDLILPELPGEEVCRRLKRNSQTEKIPLIMLTAKNNEVDKVIGRVLGASAYISKPFQMEELLDRVRSLVFMSVLIFIALFSGLSVYAQEKNKDDVPPGMQILKVGNTVILIPEGTKVTDKGSQLVLEPPEQFWSRRVKDMEEEIARLRAELDKLKKDIQALKQINNLTENVQKM